MWEAFCSRTGESRRSLRKGEEDDCRWHSEGKPRGEPTEQAIVTQNAERKSDLAEYPLRKCLETVGCDFFNKIGQKRPVAKGRPRTQTTSTHTSATHCYGIGTMAHGLLLSQLDDGFAWHCKERTAWGDRTALSMPSDQSRFSG